jgi:hypothetical protein
MRKRLLVAAGVTALVTVVAVPVMVAAATPSPTVKPAVPVRATITTKADDHGGLAKAEDKAKAKDDAARRTHKREAEPGDDNGGRGEVEPGDDKGGAGETEAGDDKGGGGETEAGDDKGGDD